MITEERRDKSLQYLVSTDFESAELEADVLRKEYGLELVRDRVFLVSDGNIPEREAKARQSAETQRAHEEWLQALVKFKHVKAKRTTESIVCDQWRSENANRRQGQT